MSSVNKKFSKIKIFLTGFGPFLTVTNNPAEIVTTTLFEKKSELDTQYTTLIHKEIFEVSVKGVNTLFPSFFEFVKKHSTKENELSILVHYGVSKSIAMAQLEERGQNYINDHADNNKVIEPKAEAEYIYSNLNVDEIVTKLKEKDILCSKSNSAGVYLCNYIYYTSLKHTKSLENIKSLFIHIPIFDNFSLEQNINFFKEFISVLEELYISQDNLK